MPRRKAQEPTTDPVLILKTLALCDDPLVHEYRDLHYELLLDQYQATGQRIANSERVVPLSDRKRKELMAQHESLRKAICAKYYIAGFGGGDPWEVPKADWLETLEAFHTPVLGAQTNWQTSFDSGGVIRFLMPPKGAQAFGSGDHVIYQLPPLPKEPTDGPPVLTLRLDLSQVKQNKLAPLMRQLKATIRKSLTQVPPEHRMPRGTWLNNVDQDYLRFKAHFYYKASFRWIAAMEAYPDKLTIQDQKPVYCAVPQETSVRDSVYRVHKILFRKPYAARRKNSKPLENSIRGWNCPDHGTKDCPPNCAYVRDWIRTNTPFNLR